MRQSQRLPAAAIRSRFSLSILGECTLGHAACISIIEDGTSIVPHEC